MAVQQKYPKDVKSRGYLPLKECVLLLTERPMPKYVDVMPEAMGNSVSARLRLAMKINDGLLLVLE
jgi:hypothetical protein